MSFKIKRSVFLVGLIITIFVFTTVINLPKKNYLLNNKSNEAFDLLIKQNGPYTPEGIRLTVINDSSNSMIITWYTADSASDPRVVYSIDPSLIDNKTVIPTSKNIDGTYIYNANLNNLESNKTYYYQVSSDPVNEREIVSFTTTPLYNSSKIKFMIMGDSRTQREPRREIVQKVNNNFNDINFFIHTGDIVEDGRIQSQWNNYFSDVENLTKSIPGYYIEGNHEYTNGYMYDNLPLPSNGLNSYYYNFSIGPVNFIGLNTERNIPIQTNWLENVLNKTHHNNDTLWNFAYMHQPIFNSISNRPDRSDLITSWCPIFEKYDVDLIFAGHNHYYERSYPMNRLKQYNDSSSYNFKNSSDPMYIITGGAGAPLYVRDTNPSYAPFYNSTYHFVIIEIDTDINNNETTLTLETWAMPNDYIGIYLIDNMTIVKDIIKNSISEP
ncbi:MAG: purple acid phosphatase family protein, partial [Candidatus Hodarchaeota archaeon]